MGVEGCGKVVKYWLFGLNIFVFILGVVLLGFGIYIKVEFGDYIRFDTQTDFDYVHGANILIAAGAVAAVISFMGLYGSYKEIKVLLIIYAVMVFIVFAVVVVGGSLAYSYRKKLEENVHSVFNTTLQTEYGESGNQGLTDIADKFMEKHECCGTNSYEDWQRSRFAKGQHDFVPDSCCKNKTDGCGNNFNVSDINEKGCWPIFKDIMNSKFGLIGGLAIGNAVLLIHAVILACVLVYRIKTNSGTLA